MLEKLLLIGAGGHAKVVIDAVRAQGNPYQIVVADEDTRRNGQVVSGCQIIAPIHDALIGVARFHVAVGDNSVRERISISLTEQGLVDYSIVHGQACVSESARLANGVFIAGKSIIGPDADIERGCVINHGAIVDHDCSIEAFSHIAPNATLGGGVRVGRKALIGAGAIILPGLSIGDHCIVGAGAVVLKNLESNSVYIGLPVRKYKSEKFK